MEKEATVEIAYRLYKQDNYEEANDIITKLAENVDKEPDVEEDPFNSTLRRTLRTLAPPRKNRGSEYGDDANQ